MACESQRHMRVTQPPLGTLMWSGHVNNLYTIYKTLVSSSVYLRLKDHRLPRWARRRHDTDHKRSVGAKSHPYSDDNEKY